MQIKELNIESEEMTAFWELPKKIYAMDSVFFRVPEKINHAVAYRIFGLFLNNELIGRTVLYFNEALLYHGQKVVVFGNYEATEEASLYLPKFIDFLVTEAKLWGAAYFMGPMNGSSWEDYRLPEDINQAFFLEPHHQPYYIDQLQETGLQRLEKYTSYKAVELESALVTFDEGLAANPLVDQIHFRKIDLANFHKELEALYPMMSAAFQDALLYTPLSKESFIKKFESYGVVVNQEFTLIAEGKEGVPRGCVFCVDNWFNDEKQLIIKTIAREAGDEWKSLGQLIVRKIYKKAIDAGYKAIIHALMHQNAGSLYLSERYEGKPLNAYFLLGKKLK